MFEMPAAALRRRSRGLVLAPLAVAICGALVGVIGFTLMPQLFPFGVILWNLGAWLGLLAWAKNPWPTISRGALAANHDGIRVDGAPYIDRAEISDAYLVPAAGGDDARVRIRGRAFLDHVDVVVPHEAAGRGLLEALGLDAAHALVRFNAVSLPMRAWWTQATFALCFLLATRIFVAPHLTIPLILPLFALAYVPTRVAVGSDGVRTSWLGLGRFIAYREIERVGTDHIGVYLELKDGSTFRIRTSWSTRGGILFNAAFASNAEALAERIEQARAAHAGGGDENASALLRPGEKPLRAWLRDLRALGSGATDSFRTAAVPEERLWRILESPSAESIDRVAAAIALGADDERRARIRVAAEATASPTARVALEAVAEGDEEQIAAAIEAMEGGDPKV